jgi:hypothetical protein
VENTYIVEMSHVRDPSPGESGERPNDGRWAPELNGTQNSATTVPKDEDLDSFYHPTHMPIRLVSKLPLEDGVLFNSIRTEDGILDSSPFELEFQLDEEIFNVFNESTSENTRPDGAEPAVRRATASDVADKSLADSFSACIHAEVTMYSGAQVQVYTEDLPHASPIAELEVKVVAISQTERKLTLRVQRAFPLSSSHMAGAKFRMAFVFDIPQRDVPIIVFTPPFRVLAKMGKKGTKNKQIHMPKYSHLPMPRASRLELIIASSIPLRSVLDSCTDNAIYVPEHILRQAMEHVRADGRVTLAALEPLLKYQSAVGQAEERPSAMEAISAENVPGSPTSHSSDATESEVDHEPHQGSATAPAAATHLVTYRQRGSRNAPHRRRVLVRGPGGRFARSADSDGGAVSGTKRNRERPERVAAASTGEARPGAALGAGERMKTRPRIPSHQSDSEYYFFGHRPTKRKREGEEEVFSGLAAPGGGAPQHYTTSPPHGTATPVQFRMMGAPQVPSMYLPPSAQPAFTRHDGISMVPYRQSEFPPVPVAPAVPIYQYSSAPSPTEMNWVTSSPMYSSSYATSTTLPAPMLYPPESQSLAPQRVPSFTGLPDGGFPDVPPSLSDRDRETSMGLVMDTAQLGINPESSEYDSYMPSKGNIVFSSRPMGGGF